MRIKNQAQLEALLKASEERAKGLQAKPIPTVIPQNLLNAQKGKETQQTVIASENKQWRLLGIDTALRKTGWGIIDAHGSKFRAVDCGVIVNPQKASLTECLRRLTLAIKSLLTEYSPDIAVIEGGFYCENARTAIILGTARGAVLGVLSEAELPVYEYAPRKVKQSICGFGNASKGQVALVISQMLGIQVQHLADDSTDAMGLAITHAQAMSMMSGLGLPKEL
jgi:crossover junction endodeoxyribonuclease RuvC